MREASIVASATGAGQGHSAQAQTQASTRQREKELFRYFHHVQYILSVFEMNLGLGETVWCGVAPATGTVPGVIGAGHGLTLLFFFRNRKTAAHRASSVRSKPNVTVVNPILPVKGSMYWEELTAVTVISRLPSWGAHLQRRAPAKCVALRDRRLCEAVINVVVSNADTEAGEHCYAIFGGGKNAVLQAGRGAAANFRQRTFLPEGHGFPVFTIPAILQQERNTSQGVTFRGQPYLSQCSHRQVDSQR